MMFDKHTTTDELGKMIAEARATEEAAKAALYVNDRPMYVPDEHQSRVTAIETERRQAVDAVTTEVQRRVTEIDEQLLPADADPVTTLKGDDLTRAAALAPFVREDIEAGNFAAKLRAVVKSGDAASRAVWLRYVNVRDERGLSRWDDDVQELVKQLEPIVRPPDKRQDELRVRQDELMSIQVKEATTNFMQRTYGRR